MGKIIRLSAKEVEQILADYAPRAEKARKEHPCPPRNDNEKSPSEEQ